VLETDKQLLIKIIRKHLPQVTLYLFGSRARGDYRSESDIDIALDTGKSIDPFILSTIQEEVEESIIPFTVDIVDMHNIAETLKNQIIKDGILWH
jgi:hypothetical protein